MSRHALLPVLDEPSSDFKITRMCAIVITLFVIKAVCVLACFLRGYFLSCCSYRTYSGAQTIVIVQ